MNITIVGPGYVGQVTGTCLAQVCHHVICVDNNEQKVADAHFGLVKELGTRRSSSTAAISFDREMLVKMGFDYNGIGRKPLNPITL